MVNMYYLPKLQKRDIILDFMQKLKREAERIPLFRSISRWGILVVVALSAHAADIQEPLPWTSGQILSLEGTNEIVVSTAPDPSIEALKKLENSSSESLSTNESAKEKSRQTKRQKCSC